jgi:hypothetical protein
VVGLVGAKHVLGDRLGIVYGIANIFKANATSFGRSVLVTEDFAAGRLVLLFPEARLDVEWGYDLVYRMGNQDAPKVQT